MGRSSMNSPIKQFRKVLRANPPENAVISYDRESDELLVYFDPEAAERPGVGRRIAPDLWLRQDRETGEALGFQVEHFLSTVAPRRPALLVFLDLADLNGITAEETGVLRRQFATEHPREVIHEAFGAMPSLAL